MDRQNLISKGDTIFATGVFLEPVNISKTDIEDWRWIAVGFEDDSYLDGTAINPSERADNIESTISFFED